ncbi:MAG TPA: cytochrome c oxidase subunit II [Pyrinomonadaceae bacterium]
MGRALAVLIWLLTLASVVLFFSGWWFPVTIAEHGPRIDQQFLITIVVVGIAFVAAQIGLGYMVWRYGANKQNRSERATYTHGNNRLEVIWTVVTAAIFIGLAVMGQRVWAQLHFNQAPANAFRIRVLAQQFEWSFHYPGPDGKFGPTDPKFINEEEQNTVGLNKSDPSSQDDLIAKQLIVPAGRPVELILRAKDVTHSFWVPQLRFKQDLVPGMEIPVHFLVMPDKAGRYQIACAELCGMNHYKMQSEMLALPEAEFNELVNMPRKTIEERAAVSKKIQDFIGKYPLINN